ncbi:MAG: TIGR04348 family glycosyltransferase [Proteobacteria bacterium]|nr:TIGR04348 family glycosyltransferase [Pseudomonadota bacterium]
MVLVNEGRVLIVSPAVASNNNGNWHTAARWQQFLSGPFEVDLDQRWDGTPAAAMIALHARKSADSVQAFRRAFPDRPIALVFTGTDIYGEQAAGAQASESSRDATHLVVLQELALDQLSEQERSRARVILQSAPQLPATDRAGEGARAFVAVGHLRDVKDPLTLMSAARLLRDSSPGIRLVHVGDALDAALAASAVQTAAECPNYQWLGSLAHEAARSQIANARALVHMSRAEGGANVVIEAIRCGVPVLASRIDGNVGLLGPDYQGYFPVGDFEALAMLLRAVHIDDVLHARLCAQCAARAPLFAPEMEKEAVRSLVRDMLAG